MLPGPKRVPGSALQPLTIACGPRRRGVVWVRRQPLGTDPEPAAPWLLAGSRRRRDTTEPHAAAPARRAAVDASAARGLSLAHWAAPAPLRFFARAGGSGTPAPRDDQRAVRPLPPPPIFIDPSPTTSFVAYAVAALALRYRVHCELARNLSAEKNVPTWVQTPLCRWPGAGEEVPSR